MWPLSQQRNISLCGAISEPLANLNSPHHYSRVISVSLFFSFFFFSFLKDPEPCGSTLFFSFNGANFSATKNTWTFASLIFSLHHAIQSVNDTWRNSEAGARPLAALHHGCNGGYHAILNAEPNYSQYGMVTNEFWKHDPVLSFYYTRISYSVHWIYPKLQKPMNSNNGCIVRFTTQLLDHAHKLRNWESKRQKVQHCFLKSGYTTDMIVLSKPIIFGCEHDHLCVRWQKGWRWNDRLKPFQVTLAKLMDPRHHRSVTSIFK